MFGKLSKQFGITAIVIAVLVAAGLLVKTRCTPVTPVLPPNPVVAVTPITDIGEINNLNLPDLPSGEKPVTVIPVATPKPSPGIITTPHVVVSDKGNTYIAYVDKIDWGFRLDPRVFIGLSDKPFAGVGFGFFRYWRFNIDY